jgi:hypothetical protein
MAVPQVRWMIYVMENPNLKWMIENRALAFFFLPTHIPTGRKAGHSRSIWGINEP